MFKRWLIATLVLSALVSSSSIQIYASSSTLWNSIGIAHAAVGSLKGVYIYAESATSNGTGSSFAITDSNGNYNMTTGLIAGTYNLTTFANGYIMSKIGPVTVVAGQTTAGINFNLQVSGGISGKVTDAVSGSPINGTTVYAFPFNGSGTFGWVGTTGSDGSYLIVTNLPTGKYNVSVLLPVGHIGKTMTVNVTAGVETKNVNLQLARSGIISGKVSAPNGTGLFGISVTAFTSSGVSYFGSATTDVSGNFRITSGLGTGNYTVYASGDGNFTAYGGFFTPTQVAVTAGQEKSNINIQLTPVTTPPTPSGVISGRITDTSNNPVGSATVTATGSGGTSSDETDNNGYYTISQGLKTGTYNVSATASGYYDAFYPSLVSVTVGQTTSNINIKMNAKPAANFGTITGTVRGELNIVPEFSNFTIEIMALILVATITVIMTRKIRRYANKDDII